MKHGSDAYVQAVKAWDKIHRIIGKENPSELYRQSRQSLSSTGELGIQEKTIIDIGAGSGMMGLAWLEMSPEHRAIFAEPKKKASSFLLNYISVVCPDLSGRALVLAHKWEDVSRETVLRFSQGGFFAVSRAFSGESDLNTVWNKSNFAADPCYVFSVDIAHSGKEKYSLKRLNKNQ